PPTLPHPPHPFPTRRSSDLNALRRLAAPPHEPDPDRDQHQEWQEREQQAAQAAGVLLDNGRDIVALQQWKEGRVGQPDVIRHRRDRKSTRLNSSHQIISYAV